MAATTHDVAASLGHVHQVLGSIHRRLDALERQIEILPHRLWTGLDDRLAPPAPGSDMSRALQLALKAFTDTMFASMASTLPVDAPSSVSTYVSAPTVSLFDSAIPPAAPVAVNGDHLASTPPSSTAIVPAKSPVTLPASTATAIPKNTPQVPAPPPCIPPRLFEWADGTTHRRVPETWSFPKKANLRTMWDLWHFGDTTVGVCPFRFLPSQDLKEREDKSCLSRASRVMRTMATIAIDHEFVQSEDDISQLGPAEYDDVYNRTFHILINPPTNHSIGEKPMVNVQRLARFSFQNVYKHFFITEGSRARHAPPKLPAGWDMPRKMNCRDVWRLWFHGDRDNHVCPLSQVTYWDFNGSSSKKDAGSRLGNARLVVERLVQMAVSEGFVASEDVLGEHMDVQTLDTVFDNAFDMLLNYNPTGNLAGPDVGQLRGEKADEYLYNSVAKAIRDMDKKRKRVE
ncbi:hypothetical protein DYB25_007252 [Aphanomyces astaci]|uniref:Uncharacterized protein n=1 Tax=Aphanomyces astaci TaxID=112090 RepID=A0A397BSN0_APHAT|nr:hypothetical protein DYB25_007252 [Aphanomyces astaci]